MAQAERRRFGQSSRVLAATTIEVSRILGRALVPDEGAERHRPNREGRDPTVVQRGIVLLPKVSSSMPKICKDMPKTLPIFRKKFVPGWGRLCWASFASTLRWKRRATRTRRRSRRRHSPRGRWGPPRPGCQRYHARRTSRPVGDDIAAILRRMQPRWQR